MPRSQALGGGWAAWSPSETTRSFPPFFREEWLREHYSSLFVNLTSRHSASHQLPTPCHFDARVTALFDPQRERAFSVAGRAARTLA